MSAPQLRRGKWRIQWTDVSGKRCSATYATKNQARDALRRFEVKADDDRILGQHLGPLALTVTEAWERFRAGWKLEPGNTLRRFTSRNKVHTGHFDLHIAPHIGTRKLCDLTPTVLREWIGVLAATLTARHGEKNEDKRTLSASTIRAIVTTLRQIAKSNDVPLQVMLGQSLRQKRRRSRPKAFQCIEDVRAFLAAAGREPWFKVAAAIACHAGARLGEVASLRWRHIGEQTITIALSWEGPLKARYEDDDEAARIVPLDPDLAEILAAWRKLTNGGPNDHVVLVNGTRPLREGFDDVAQKTRSACKRAKVTPLTFHSLRASYATLVADRGLPVSTLAALLGHADIATTGIYLRPESSRAALDPRARISAPVLHPQDSAAAEMLN